MRSGALHLLGKMPWLLFFPSKNSVETTDIEMILFITAYVRITPKELGQHQETNSTLYVARLKIAFSPKH